MKKFITKFDRGRLIVAGGNSGSLFPVYLASQAAKLTGCGMVVDIVPLIAVPTLEAMNPLCKIYGVDPIFDNKKRKELKEIEDLFCYSKAVLIGPGMDWENKKKQKFVNFCFCQKNISIIIDSDGLDTVQEGNILSKGECKAKAVIIIANLKESLKLVGQKSARGVEKSSLIKKLCAFSFRNSCYVLHKGYGFMLFLPNGKVRRLPVKSTVRMATAGMGDILAGYISGFMVADKTPVEAIELSLVLRQQAAESYLRSNPNAFNISPQDIINYTPITIGNLSKKFPLLLKK